MSTGWWLVIAVAIILAVTLAALYGLAWGPIEGAQGPTEVSSSPAPPPQVLQAGTGAAHVTLPPLAVSDAVREAPKVVPPSETRDTTARPRISAWLPRRKPTPSQTALLTDSGNGVFVQLGSVKSAVGAKREWDRLVGEFPGVLSGRPLKIERVALANRGDFYRIRTGPISGLTRAQAICAEFVARDRGCLVVRR